MKVKNRKIGHPVGTWKVGTVKVLWWWVGRC